MAETGEPRPIKLLSTEVRSQLRSGIATPSVIQCVEELVVNSIDAGASCIAVRLDLSSYKIQVIDNGKGIPYESLPLIGERYATSKCHDLTDLDNLSYYGYRGEALSSIRDISSVLEVNTRSRGSNDTYTKLFQHGKDLGVSKSVKQRPSGGTTTTAHNIFYNMPVRQQVLSFPLVYEKICKRLQALALIHPSISLTLRDDSTGAISIQTHNSSSVANTFGYLFGRDLAESLKEVTHIHSHFNVSGFIATRGHRNKNLQFVYVNGRLVLKTKLHKAVNDLLKQSLIVKCRSQNSDSPANLGKYQRSPSYQSSPGKNPSEYGIFVLNVTCPRNEYDITLDPAKTLVEFKDWNGAIMCVQELVTCFLRRENLTMKPSMLQEQCVAETDISIQKAPDGDPSNRSYKNIESVDNEAFASTISAMDCRNAVQSTSVRRQKPTEVLEGYIVTDKSDEKAGNTSDIDAGELNCKTVTYCSATSSNNSKSPPNLLENSPIVIPESAESEPQDLQNLQDYMYNNSLSEEVGSNVPKEWGLQSISEIDDNSKLVCREALPDSPILSCESTLDHRQLKNNCYVSDSSSALSSLSTSTFNSKHDKWNPALSLSSELTKTGSSFNTPFEDDQMSKSERGGRENQCTRHVRTNSHDAVNLHVIAQSHVPKRSDNVGEQLTSRTFQKDKLSVSVRNSLSVFRRSVGKERLSKSVGQHMNDRVWPSGNEAQQCSTKESKPIALRWHRSPGFRSRLAQLNVKCQERPENTTVSSVSVFDGMHNVSEEQNQEKLLSDEQCNIGEEPEQNANGVSISSSAKEEMKVLKHHSKVSSPAHHVAHSGHAYGRRMDIKDIAKHHHTSVASNALSDKISSKRSSIDNFPCPVSHKMAKTGRTQANACNQDHPVQSSREKEFYTTNSFLECAHDVFGEHRTQVQITHADHLHDNMQEEERPPVRQTKLRSETNVPTGTVENTNLLSSIQEDKEPSLKEIGSICTWNRVISDVQETEGSVFTHVHRQDAEMSQKVVQSEVDVNMEISDISKQDSELETMGACPGERNHIQNAAPEDAITVSKSFHLAEMKLTDLTSLTTSSTTNSTCASRTYSPDTVPKPVPVAASDSCKTHKAVRIDTTSAASADTNSQEEFVSESREWYSIYDKSLGKKIYINRISGNCSLECPDQEERRPGRNEELFNKEANFSMITKRDTLAHPHLPHSASSFVSSLRDQKGRVGDLDPKCQSLNPVAMETLDAVLEDHQIDDDELRTVKWGNKSFCKENEDNSNYEAACLSSSNQAVGSIQGFQTSVVGERTTGIDAKFQAKIFASLNPCQFTRAMFENITVCGQVDAKFIACLVNIDQESSPAGEPSLLVLVDQHAAHERIRLEMLTAEAYGSSQSGQDGGGVRTSIVTPPLPVRLSPSELRLVRAFRHKFVRVGVDYTTPEDDDDCVLVTHLPACVVEKEANELKRGRQTVAASIAETLIKEQLDLLERQSGASSILPKTITRILNSQACHGAIKFGDALDLAECRSLIGQLSSCDLPFQCAHGRPALMPIIDMKKLRQRNPKEARAPPPQLWKLNYRPKDTKGC